MHEGGREGGERRGRTGFEICTHPCIRASVQTCVRADTNGSTRPPTLLAKCSSELHRTAPVDRSAGWMPPLHHLFLQVVRGRVVADGDDSRHVIDDRDHIVLVNYFDSCDRNEENLSCLGSLG